MKKLLFTTLFLVITQLAISQWVSTLDYSTYIGDNNSLSSAKGQAVSVGTDGNCYVVGFCLDESLTTDIIIIKYDIFGDTLWVRTYHGTGNSDDKAFGIVVDTDGFIYVTGYETDAETGKNIILLKYNSSGELLWNVHYTDETEALNDEGLGITIDANQNVYVTGYYTHPNETSGNIITLKYNSIGTLIWSQEILNGHGQGNAITVDKQNNIYVTGYYNSGSSNNVITIKYKKSGEWQWQQIFNIPGYNDGQAYGVVVDALNNIYVTGYITNTSMNTDCLLLKYNSFGELQETAYYDGGVNGNDKAFGIVVDSDYCPIITGSSSNGFNVDFVTLKYNTSGEQQWCKKYNNTEKDGKDEAVSIGLLEINDTTTYVIVAGLSMGTDANFDYQIILYNVADGSIIDSSRYAYSSNSDDIPTDLIVSPDNEVFITGYSELIIQSVVPQSKVTTMKLKFNNHLSNEIDKNIPENYKLFQNFPNPFNPSTIIKFDISKGKDVKLTIYDMLGRTVDVLADNYFSAGSYSIYYSNSKLASGIYFYELKTDEYRVVKKMTLIK